MKLRLKIDSLLAKKQITLAWLPSHIGIDGNELADTAAKEALELEEIKIKRLHYTDYRKKVREHVHSLWEERWAAQVRNKLHELKTKAATQKTWLSAKERLCDLHTLKNWPHITYPQIPARRKRRPRMRQLQLQTHCPAFAAGVY